MSYSSTEIWRFIYHVDKAWLYRNHEKYNHSKDAFPSMTRFIFPSNGRNPRMTLFYFNQMDDIQEKKGTFNIFTLDLYDISWL